MVRLSRKHSRELRKHAESSSSPGRRRRSSSSSSSPSGPFNLRKHEPRYSSEYGSLGEARPDDFRQLGDLDISVTFIDLKKGSLFLPHYHSKAILVAQVIEGTAKLEIASPHLANQRSEEQEGEEISEEEEDEERSEGQMQRASSWLNQDDIFVVLADHPVAFRASRTSNVRAIAFLLNAKNNQRNFIRGERGNVIKQIDRRVKGMVFQGSGEEVERLLRNQKELYFVNAQRRRQPSFEEEEEEEQRAPSLSSILEAYF